MTTNVYSNVKEQIESKRSDLPQHVISWSKLVLVVERIQYRLAEAQIVSLNWPIRKNSRLLFKMKAFAIIFLPFMYN